MTHISTALSSVALCQNRHLSPLSYADGFALWLYRVQHSLVVVDGAGYFNSASALFNRGDLILVVADDLSVGWRIVVSVTDGSVVVNAAGGVSNSTAGV